MLSWFSEFDIIENRGISIFFFSREESRPHVHVTSPDGEAKFWLEPTISLAQYEGFSKAQLRKLQKLVEDNYEEFIEAWKSHFKM